MPEYTHLPAFTEASWAWNGEPGQAPETVLICTDRAGDYVLVALWPDSSGCRIGLVPLGGGQQAGELECSMLDRLAPPRHRPCPGPRAVSRRG